eukprot:14290367-Ditylum_brightwellii.AAC.1
MEYLGSCQPWRHQEPPLQLLRGASIKQVQYSFGDASGGGFGVTFKVGDDIQYQVGTWSNVASS